MKTLLLTLCLAISVSCSESPDFTPEESAIITLQMTEFNVGMVLRNESPRKDYKLFLNSAAEELTKVPNGELKSEMAAALRALEQADISWDDAAECERLRERARAHTARAKELLKSPRIN